MKKFIMFCVALTYVALIYAFYEFSNYLLNLAFLNDSGILFFMALIVPFWLIITTTNILSSILENVRKM